VSKPVSFDTNATASISETQSHMQPVVVLEHMNLAR